MNFNKKRYLVKNLEKLCIRIFNIIIYTNKNIFFTLLILFLIFINRVISKENSFNIYSLGLFFNYNDIKEKIEKIIIICFFYFFFSQLEQNFFFYQ